MQLDPAADPARRVWLACTPCGADDSLFMLDSRANLVLVTCQACGALYWLETSCGHRRPAHIDAEPPWPFNWRS